MRVIERDPLPLVCQKCIAEQEATGEIDDCYNCDNALERWIIKGEGTASLEATRD